MSQTLAIPPGYRSLVLLDKTRHRSRGVCANAATFAAKLNTVPLRVIEFIPAARSYPIVFAREPSGNAVPLALTGLRDGQNLFVSPSGEWRDDSYCPAYVRRYPFYPVEMRQSDEQLIAIAVDDTALDESLPHLIDGNGRPTPRWQEIQRFIEDAEAAQRQTVAFCAQLVALSLLEEFAADINPASGVRHRLHGMCRVNEDRLKALPADTLHSLVQNGYLARVYAHLLSLDNFQRLMQLAAARTEH